MPDSSLKELMLRRPALSLAVAESVTCGRLQARIGAISGASEFFRGGITAYTLDQKVRHLGVDRAEAEAVDCVSAGIAGQMARGALDLFGADVAIATTGYAEPHPSRAVTEPYAFWSMAWRRPGGPEMRTERIGCPGLGRVAVQERVAEAALAALFEWLKAARP